MAYGLIDLKNLVERLVEETNESKKTRMNSVDFITSENPKKEGTLYFSITDLDLAEAVKKHIRTYLFREEFLNRRKIVPVSEVRIEVCGNTMTTRSRGLPSAGLDDVYVDFYVKK
ncbi:MAG: hypothetical protein QME12_07500 [Nanoarchaeota archaeon]|nr:hypothetical protein [Nanoarchaeota archaeon]